jgi:hypothetical protein
MVKQAASSSVSRDQFLNSSATRTSTKRAVRATEHLIATEHVMTQQGGRWRLTAALMAPETPGALR